MEAGWARELAVPDMCLGKLCSFFASDVREERCGRCGAAGGWNWGAAPRNVIRAGYVSLLRFQSARPPVARRVKCGVAQHAEPSDAFNRRINSWRIDIIAQV